jgi:protein-tyrosine phosphatase
MGWNACYNVRDVGGYRTVDGRTLRWGALVRADNLGRLTEAGRAALAAYGVRTVVDLRRGSELATAAHPYTESSDPAYVNVDLDASVPELLALLPTEYYGRVLDVRAASLAEAVAAFASAVPGGVLFHCQSGKDRTGIVVALLLALAGVPRATIVADYVLTDECLAAYREEVLRGATGEPTQLIADLERWRARPEKIERTLDRLQALGGAEAWSCVGPVDA